MARPSKFSVMIVDDSDVEREALKKILDPIYNVIIAKSGKSALKKALDEHPGIILLDIVMPKINGFEVLASLKESEFTRDIPVLCITGLDNVEDEEKGLFLGAVDYIRKPYNSAIVKARIRTHVQIVQYIRTIEKLGMTDVLTGVSNKRHFDYKMHTEWARALRKKTPISLILLDVRAFKHLNTRWGYPKGDEILREIAKAITSSLKKTNSLVARLSGDQFAVLMPNMESDPAEELAKNICSLAQRLELASDAGEQIAVTLCAGVATIKPTEDGAISGFFEDADAALCTAKSSGQDYVCTY